MTILPFNFAHANQVLKKRKHARDNLWEFANQTLLKKIPNRVPARHHEVLCQRLEEFINDPEDGIMIILMPPGSAKTLFVGHALPSWFMGNRPGARVAMVTNSLPLAERGGRAIRDIVSSKAYDQIFEGVGVSQTSAAVASFQLTNGSEFLGVGVGGAIMGRRCELIVIDDPISGFAEAQSESQLAKLHDAYKAAIRTRLVPNGKLVLIQQRLSRNDLAGFIMDTSAAEPEGRKLTVLKMPMLCNDEENDPLGRKLGEPLWPAYYTKGMLVDAQADEYIWQTLYMQEPPTDSGTWASSDDIQWMPNPTDVTINPDYQIYVCCDLAITEGAGDYTVFAVLAVHRKTGHMFVIDMYREREHSAATAEKIVELCRTWQPIEVLIEDDNAAKVWLRLVAERARHHGVNVPIKQIKIAGQQKEIRAAGLRGMIKMKRLYLDSSQPWTRHIIREILAFPHALGVGVDDIIDALGTIGRRLPAMMINKPAVEVQRKVVQGMIIDNPDGSRHFRATFGEMIEDADLSASNYGRCKRF
jgi:predicted phage terminase large subunit-like protein